MLAKRFTSYISRYKWAVILFWALAFLILGIKFGSGILDSTQVSFQPSDDAEASQAKFILASEFQNVSQSSSYIITLKRANGGSILGSDTRNLTLGLASHLLSPSTVESCFEGINASELVLRYYSYYSFENTELDYLKANFVSEDQSVSFILIDLKAETLDDGVDLVSPLKHSVDQVIEAVNASDLEYYITGYAPWAKEYMEGIERDMRKIDLIVLPLSFLLLIFLLRGVRMAGLSLLTVFGSILISFGILERLIAYAGLNVLSFTPAVLASLTLGIGVDYTLFVLSRYREERNAGKGIQESVEIMLHYSGHNIIVSGLTLFVATLSLVLIPLTFIGSLGIAIGIGVLVTLLANLTLIPSILLAFGNWFTGGDPQKQDHKPSSSSNNSKPMPRSTPKSEPHNSYWYKVGRFATTHPWKIIIVVTLLAMPVAYQVLQSDYGVGFEVISPRNSEVLEGYSLLKDEFTPGLLVPFYIVMEAKNNVLTAEFFNDQVRIAEFMISQLGVNAYMISSIAWLNGSSFSFTYAQLAYGTENVSALPRELQTYLLFSSRYISSSGKYAFMEVFIAGDPLGNEGQAFIKDMRKFLAETQFAGLADAYVGGRAAEMFDLRDESYEFFPLMIIIVVIAVYLLIGLLFKSAFLPARLLITVGLTLSFIYGATELVFVKMSFLNNMFPSLASTEAVFFLVPILSFSIIIGLGLDYDIFTVERVKEFAWKGHPNRESIQLALEKTGGLITGAGGVMVIALGGLMFSEIGVLNQFGFVLAFSVLLDTFVVRTLLVPAIMAISEKWNWWPSSPPNQ